MKAAFLTHVWRGLNYIAILVQLNTRHPARIEFMYKLSPRYEERIVCRNLFCILVRDRRELLRLAQQENRFGGKMIEQRGKCAVLRL